MKRVLLWFDTRRLTVAILFVALFAMAVRAPVDTDTWWHLQAGRVTVESGRILQVDLFSHTRAGSPWVNHSWLSQVVLYLLFERLGYAGLGFFLGAVVAVTFLFVYLQMEGDPFVRALIVIVAAATSAVIWAARPQILSFLLTAVVAYLLYLFKWKQVNRLWLLPPLFVLWVNLHAGYALGFMLLAAFVIGELFNHLLALLPGGDENCPAVPWRGLAFLVGMALLSLLLLTINPNGVRMWVYYLDTVKIGVLQDFIQEWRSPDFHPLYTQPFIWLLLGTLAAMGLSGRRADGSDLAMVGMFAYAALLAGRNFGPFALVTAPVLSRHAVAMLERWGWNRLLRPARQRVLLGAVNVGLLVAVVVLAGVKVAVPLSAAFNEAEQRKIVPVDAVAWVRAHRPDGQMFNHYNWGGYLIWALWPDYQVFVDGRTDLYGDDLLGDYIEIQRGGPEAAALLDEYGVDWVLTGSGDGLSLALDCNPNWQQVYKDAQATIYLRQHE
jgi:hypothetical protein